MTALRFAAVVLSPATESQLADATAAGHTAGAVLVTPGRDMSTIRQSADGRFLSFASAVQLPAVTPDAIAAAFRTTGLSALVLGAEQIPANLSRLAVTCISDLAGHPVDIIHVTPRPDWQRVTARARFAMLSAGRRETLTELPSPSAERLTSEIRDRRPRLVFVHAFAVPASRLLELAEQWPQVQFVLVSHSQENHVYTWPQYFAEMAACLDASKQLGNLTMAGSDDSGHWQRLGYRFHRWHWPCELQPWQEPPAVDPPTILITSRADLVKALPSQILASALLQRETGVRVAVSSNNESDQRRAGLDALTRAAGLQAERWAWVDAAGWLRRLREQVSLVLQPSMSETFNYVSWEAGACGRPWVGSPAVQHTPAAWQADPNSPADIARVGAAIMSEYGHCSRWAWEIADHVGRENNRAYAESIGRLLDRL